MRRLLTEDTARWGSRAVLGDAIGLASICVILLVGLTLPGLG